MQFFLDYWYFHIPNYIVAALIYTLLGRFVLGIFVPREWPNYIWQFFCRITDPVLEATSWVTPRFVIDSLLPLVAIFWLFALRFLYWLLLYRAGLAPTIGVAG
jgi:uncharacterized protein YggT (Ycf19 family)